MDGQPARTVHEQQWVQVRRVLGALRGLGIHYLDPTPANIRFPRADSKQP
jgi:hypothetical protein